MYNKLKIMLYTILGTGLFFGIALFFMNRTSPSGNVGDEGVVLLPLYFALWAMLAAGVILSLIYLIKERPRDKKLILPCTLLILGLIPFVMFYHVVHSRDLERQRDMNAISLSKQQAIQSIQECKLVWLEEETSKNPELYDKDYRHREYVLQKDINDIKFELEKSKQNCNP
jgi:hypothetical protein